MSVTEKEAAEKWCPHARMIADNGGLAFNRTEPLVDATRCIGSRCMAWRWGGWKVANEPFPEWNFALAQSVARQRGLIAEHIGWCGLAGAP